MALINASLVLGYLKTFRVLHIGGRYGGGKTALAFRLAVELLEQGFVRYCVSNVASVFSEPFSKIALREGVYADCVIVLDEAGIFLKTSADVDSFLAFMRKMNIVLIMPSVLEPPSKVRFFQVMRTMNGNAWGLPFWLYRVDLHYGRSSERDYFVWWRPSEVFGLYDTLGFPADDGGIGEFIQSVTSQAKKNAGYGDSGYSPAASGSRDNDSVAVLEALRGLAYSIDESAGTIASSVSVLSNRKNSKRRR